MEQRLRCAISNCLLVIVAGLMSLTFAASALSKPRTKVKWRKVQGAAYYVIVNIRSDDKGFRLKTRKHYIYLPNIPKEIGVWAYSKKGKPIARPDLILFDLKRHKMVRKRQSDLETAPAPPSAEEIEQARTMAELERGMQEAFDHPPFRRLDVGFVLGLETLEARAGSSSFNGDSGFGGMEIRALMDMHRLRPEQRWGLELTMRFRQFNVTSPSSSETASATAGEQSFSRNDFMVGWGYGLWYEEWFTATMLAGWGFNNMVLLGKGSDDTTNKDLSSVVLQSPTIGLELRWKLFDAHSLRVRGMSAPLTISDDVDSYAKTDIELGYTMDLFDGAIQLRTYLSQVADEATTTVDCPADKPDCRSEGTSAASALIFGGAAAVLF